MQKWCMYCKTPFLSGILAFAMAFPAIVAADEEVLFNGKNLDGWKGHSHFWSVTDGIIVGETTAENPTKGNTFLIWQGCELSDF